ncbi:MAG: response regulator [Candidatus Omnitrophota bacterium]
MKIKTKLTITLLACYTIIIIVFLGFIGGVIMRHQGKNLIALKNDFLSTFLIIVLGFLLIVLTAIWVSKKWIFDPLEKLIENFGLVARGELYHRLEIKSNDEIGKISESFNNMTEHLNQSVNEIRAVNIKLDSYSRDLESRVNRRTRELSDAVEQLKREIEERKQIEEDLKKARMEAESANISKSQFLANMSHEIRTPMNAIIGMCELVLDTKLNTEQEEYLNTLKNSSESLLGLLNDILDLSKIEVGKLDVEPIEFHLRECLAAIAKNMSVQAQRKNIELIYDIELNVPNVVIGDPGRLRQVLTNLIGNAIKFTERGMIVLRIKKDTGKETTGGSTQSEFTLQFTVSDTGMGIAKEKQALIFEKFYQTDSSITRKFGGSGLGLAISMQLIQLMGGKIWVESPGELQLMAINAPGSSFYFTLPFKIPKDKKDSGEPADIKELAGVPVLVVDDNVINRKIYNEMLKRWGLIPTLAESGFKALAFLKQAAHEHRSFQLILVDVQMPEMDGFELVRRMQEEDIKKPQVIVLTSMGIKGDGKMCRELGISAYLKKPVPSSELLEALLLVMGNLAREKKDNPLVTKHVLKESRKHLNILIAEDNLINQKLICRILEKKGFHVSIANNGKETLEKLEAGDYDLVLMDIQMPVLDGIEATKLIRRNEERNGLLPVPIIALTAHAMKGDRERFLDAGMNSYISKPIKQSELIEVIEAFTRDKKG